MPANDPLLTVPSFRYGSTLVLNSEAFSGYALSGPTIQAEGGQTLAFATARTKAERWYVLNPANLADKSRVRFGDVVALSCCAQPGWCLSVGAIPAGPPIRPVLTSNALDAAARWKFVDPANPASTELVGLGRAVGLRTESGTPFHLSCGWKAAPPQPRIGAAAVPQCDAWEKLRLVAADAATLAVQPGGARPAADAPRLQSTTGWGKEITGPNERTAVAGEPVKLVLVNNGGVTGHTVLWTVTGPTVENYFELDGTIVSVPPEFFGEDIEFYWSAAGQYTVTCHVAGMWVYDDLIGLFGTSTKVMTYTVTAPSVVYARTQSGTVRFAPAKTKAVGPRRTPVSIGEVCFEGVQLIGVDNPGILMRAHVAPEPTGRRGSVRWVQLVQSDRFIVSDSGRRQESSTNEQFWLDHKAPYSRGDQPCSGVLEEFKEGDAPSQAFYGETFAALGARAAQSVGIMESFRMYLMWKSDQPQSIWVTLGRFDWNWSTRITSDADGEYRIQDIATDYTGKEERIRLDLDVAHHELPTWRYVLNNSDFGSALEGGASSGEAPPDWPTDRHGFDDPHQSNGDRLVVVLLNRGKPDFRPGPPPPWVPEHSNRLDAERALNRRLGLELKSLGTGWWVTLASPDRVATVGLLSEARVLPRESVLAPFTLDPSPPFAFGLRKPFWFCATIAPFCFDDPAYWDNFVHHLGTLRDDKFGDDITIDGYRAKIRALVPGIQVLRRAEDQCSVWVVFPLGVTPTWAQINAIADLRQTYRLRRVADNEVHLPPVPEPHVETS